jgi:hypothetical protein
MTRAGFDVICASYVFAPLTGPLFALRSLPYRMGRRLSEPVVDVEARAAAQHVPVAVAR